MTRQTHIFILSYSKFTAAAFPSSDARLTDSLLFPSTTIQRLSQFLLNEPVRREQAIEQTGSFGGSTLEADNLWMNQPISLGSHRPGASHSLSKILIFRTAVTS